MFLATTALEEFWDKEQQIVFLGEWCKLYTRKQEWEKLDYIDLPFVWDSTTALEEAIIYCSEIYEKTLEELTLKLNIIHEIEKDKRFYRILLGNWLLSFIQQLYDKYLHLNTAFEKYPGLKTYTLSEDQHIIPVKHYDSVINTRGTKGDEYSLQLYSQIINEMGIPSESKRLLNPLRQESSFHINGDVSSRLSVAFTRLQHMLNRAFQDRSLTMTNPYFKYKPFKNMFSILVRSRGRVILDNMRYQVKTDYKIRRGLREKTRLSLSGDKFKTILSRLIFRNIPILFLENFKSFSDAVKSMPIKNSEAYYTANATAFNNIFKFHMAENHGSAKLLIHQHGGGYGVDLMHLSEEYERSICDIYYTWGWGRTEKVRYLPPPVKSCGGRKNKGSVLMTLVSRPRYANKLHFQVFSAGYLNPHLNNVSIFLSLISGRIEMLIRIFPDKLKWNVKERIMDQGLGHKFDDYSESFIERLMMSSLCIFSNLSTTYLESLALNRPTVIFIEHAIYKFRASAQPFIDALEDAGILYYSPEAAAEHVNRVYDDIDMWWLSDQVQAAKNKFVNEYVRLSEDWAGEWAREFNRVLDIEKSENT